MARSDRRADDGDGQQVLVGARVRQFRTERGLTLRGLSAQSGLSIGFLSQVERGVSSIGLTALNSLAKALDRPVPEFFSADEPEPRSEPAAAPLHFTLTRRDDGATQYVSGQTTYRMLSDRGPDLVLEPMLVHIAPGGRREESYGHRGEEFAYVVHGELLYEVDGVEHRLLPGDSVHLRSSVPHRLYNDTDEVTTVVSVVTPRLF
ncbi:helix-turn-helix domain-containing protein [Herbidospora yilanensis]|uniref:helix-turn-helix domain-containing protein n=1 Tax=Herbidospora yilanensis TaxID=354426 RepID=UPI000A67D98E|nr:cupin domain-containing protein [Herbidospora yilanensis]